MKAWLHWGVPLVAALSLIFTAGCQPAPGYTVGGRISGASGALTLSLNGAESLQRSGNGTFMFTGRLATASSYNVTVATAPAGQQCSVINGNGAIASVSINNVNVSCTTITQFHVGGAVSGLQGTVALRLNGSDEITLNADGIFQFNDTLGLSQGYSITIASQPTGQSCSVNNGIGIVAADITDVSVTCQNSYRIGGSLLGLQGTLSLALNGNRMQLSSNGNFQFEHELTTSENYVVSIPTQPANQTCVVSNGSGTVSAADVDNIVVTCQDNTYRVSGTVTGLQGSLTLQLNGNESVLVSGGGAYQFNSALRYSDSYDVVITAQPAGQHCIVNNGSSTVYSADVRIVIGCITTTTSPLPTITDLWPNSVLDGYEVKISGNNLEQASIVYNGAEMTSTLRTANELRFIVPENPKGSYSLELQNSAGYVGLDVSQGEKMLGGTVVDVGSIHSCAVLASGIVNCWGNNATLQLGVGDRTFSNTPVAVSGISSALSVSAGTNHSCALLSNGAVQCWGGNNDGQLGNGGTPGNWSVPVTVSGISSAVAVDAGSRHSCAVLGTGAVQCWGSNNNGQLGNGTNNSSAVPVTVSGVNAAVAVGIGSNHSCAVLVSGQVQCWGQNYGSPVLVGGISSATVISSYGNRNCVRLMSGSVQCWSGASTPSAVAAITTAVSVSVGEGHSCAALANGTVQCWGDNDFGQLGNGDLIASNTPVTVIGISTAMAVNAGQDHSCALLASGLTQCWGSNVFSQLGNSGNFSDGNPFSQAVTVSGIGSARTVGMDSSGCVSLVTGQVQCWGDSADYSSISTAVAVDVGSSQSCALLSSGLVQCWNRNGGSPSFVNNLSAVISLSVGATHRCAVNRQGGVVCWGGNLDGQLGNNFVSSSSTPMLVNISGTALAVEAGGGHSCALLASGRVQCWGDNGYGQLGNFSFVDSSSPVMVTGISTAVAISLYANQSCALLASGDVRCWGNNSSQPTTTGIGGAVAIAAGSSHRCAILHAGTVECSGAYVMPENGVSSAIAIDAAGGRNCVVLANGSTQCWGENQGGGIGLPGFVMNPPGAVQPQPGVPVYYH